MANKPPYNSLSHQTFERILLEKFRVIHMAPVNVSLFTENSVMEFAQWCKYKIMKEFWSQKERITHTFEIQVPASWWQHFKQDKIHWKWFLKKFPIKTTTMSKTIQIDARRVFIDIPCPKDENGVCYEYKEHVQIVNESVYPNKLDFRL